MHSLHSLSLQFLWWCIRLSQILYSSSEMRCLSSSLLEDVHTSSTDHLSSSEYFILVLLRFSLHECSTVFHICFLLTHFRVLSLLCFLSFIYSFLTSLPTASWRLSYWGWYLPSLPLGNTYTKPSDKSPKIIQFSYTIDPFLEPKIREWKWSRKKLKNSFAFSKNVYILRGHSSRDCEHKTYSNDVTMVGVVPAMA